MVGPILKEAVVLIVFCHIFVSGKDILEVFQPSPSLPKELNEWLASVQKHKNDFRLIREVAARKTNGANFRFEDEEEEDFDKKNLNQLSLEDDLEEQKLESPEESPRNDIYPYMYKSDNNYGMGGKKFNSKKGSHRLRRASDNVGFIEHKNIVNLEPKSKVGEIKRSDEKYPERYKEAFSDEQGKMKSNFKEKKDVLDADKDISKREVQIEIKKDGKLVKQITEDESIPKSIILNIEKKEEKLFPIPAAVQSQLENAQQLAESNIGNQNVQLPLNTVASLERSASPISKQAKAKEFYSNFNNLFSVNEHLNTDSSLARQSGTPMGPLIYHVTIPNFITYPEVSSSYHTQSDFRSPQHYEESKDLSLPILPNININMETKPLSNPYSFNHNNFQDMSKYWTASEKNQMQKGIAFARNNENIRKFIQHVKFPQKTQGQSENETGFEPAQRIEVDNGKLVKINVAGKGDEATETDGLIHSINYIKRNNAPVQIYNREGVIEIDGQRPNLLVGKSGNDMIDVNKNIDAIVLNNAKPFIKENINNALEASQNLRIESVKVKPELLNNVEGNSIPNIREIAKAESKRQLQFLQGKVQLVNNNDNPDNSFSKSKLLSSIDIKPNLESVVEIPKPVSSDPNFQDKLFEQPTGAVGLVDSLRSAVSQTNVNTLVPDVELLKLENQDLETDQGSNSVNEYQDMSYDGPAKDVELANVAINQFNRGHSLEDNYERGIAEDVSKCNEIDSNLEDSKFEPHSQARLEKMHELEDNYLPQRSQLHEFNGLPKVDNIHNFNTRFRDDIPAPNPGYIKIRRNPFGQQSKLYSERYDPNLKKIVIVYDPPYAPGRRRNSRYRDYLPTMVEDQPSDSNEESFESDGNNYKNQIVHLPPNLIIRKRAYPDSQIIVRKRYRKRHHDSSYLGNLVSNSKSNDNVDSSSKSSFIPKSVGRQLKTIEYVYDTYEKGDDYYDDISTELLESASESEGRVELLQKDSVEGDYGDEEDSVTEKQKKIEFNIVKKTDNEYANPRTTTENEDDYYDDYDNSSYQCNNEKSEAKEIKATEDSSSEKPKHGMKPPSEELTDPSLPGVHHGHVSPNKLKTKLTRKHSRFIPVSASKVKLEDKNDVTRKSARKISRHRRNRNKHPNKMLVDTMSDFQQWPTFVIDDQENEEKLRKRSPVLKRRYTNNFPKASKDFFVRTKRRQTNDAKAEKSTEKPVTMNFAAADIPLQVEKRETPAPVVERVTRNANPPPSDDTCNPRQLSVTNACEMDENFNKTALDVTTILSIDSPHEGSDNDTSHGVFEKIDDILDGYFPSQVVADIFEEIKQNTRLQRRFTKGLKRTNKNLCFQNLNDTNTEETRKILNSMTCLMNRLQLTATCQVLPHNIRTYLKTITRTKKEDSLAHMKQMEEVNFDENQNQKNFIFESSPQGGNNFQDKADILKGLLDKFNGLPERCKTRAQPVKEYIENHLGMLNNMLEGGSYPSSQVNEIKNVHSRSNSVQKTDDALIEEQLASLGLGRENRFTPKFDIEKLLESGRHEKPVTPGGNPQAKGRPHNANVNKRDLNSVSRSKKYNKLLDAVRKVKLKRDGERRIAEAFGKSSDYSGFNFNMRSDDAKDVAKASFESPLVYSL